MIIRDKSLEVLAFLHVLPNVYMRVITFWTDEMDSDRRTVVEMPDLIRLKPVKRRKIIFCQQEVNTGGMSSGACISVRQTLCYFLCCLIDLSEIASFRMGFQA